VIEDPGELQRRQRGERGKGERQDVLAVDAELAGAINAGGVEDLAGYRLDEIAQDEGTEPDLERAVEDDQRPVGVVQVQRVRQPVDGEHQDLEGQEAAADEREVDDEVAPESEPGERETGEG